MLKKPIFIAILLVAVVLGGTQCASRLSVDQQINLSAEQSCLEKMPAGFVYVDQVAPLVKTDLRYAGSNNFVGKPLNGYKGRRAILRKEAAIRLKSVSEELNQSGYRLIVYDAYRPHTAMEDIVKWGKDMSDQKMKSRYYPNIDKARIFEDRYVGNISEHSRGVAVDVALIVKKTGQLLDMGGHFDYLDPSSLMTSPLVSDRQRANRQILNQTMIRHGFVNYEPEWWHYRLSSEPDETAYYLFPVCDQMIVE